MSIIMRTCKKCNNSKSIEEFSINSNCLDGRTFECKKCATIRKTTWLKENPEKAKASVSKWRNKNIYELRRIGKIRTKIWTAQNPDKVRQYSIDRRARKKANSFYYVPPKYLKQLHLLPCIYCGLNKNIEADHVIPLSRGGSHSMGNLAPACRTCNASKKDRFIMEWRKKWAKSL